MIENYKYAQKCKEFLYELQQSLTQKQKDDLRKKLANQDDHQDFTSNNFEEIISFIEKTPSQRAKTKKWQKDYDLFVYYSYTFIAQTYKDTISPMADLYLINSYRTDIATITKAYFKSNEQFDFFEDD